MDNSDLIPTIITNIFIRLNSFYAVPFRCYIFGKYMWVWFVHVMNGVLISLDENGDVHVEVSAKSNANDSTSDQLTSSLNDALLECLLQFPYQSEMMRPHGCTGTTFYISRSCIF